jgi:dihydropteroate synthase
MQQHTSYADVVGEVVAELRAQRDAAVEAGIAPGRIALDPGIGFSKTGDQNWQVLAGLEQLFELGHPVLVATSRKRFLGELLAADGELRPPRERDAATAATAALSAAAGAWCVRVHHVRATADAVRVAARWCGVRDG